MDATPAPITEELSMASVLKSLSPESRTLISAAFASMDKQLKATETTNARLEKDAAQARRSEEIDKKLLSSQLETLLSQIDETTKQQHNLNMDTLNDGLVNEMDAGMMRRTVDRVLLCCNNALMQKNNEKETQKRKRPVDDQGGPEPAQETFEPFSNSQPAKQDAASMLRQALQTFDQ